MDSRLAGHNDTPAMRRIVALEDERDQMRREINALKRELAYLHRREYDRLNAERRF